MKLQTDDQRILLALEETLWRTETRYHTELMEQTFAPNFVEVGRSGRCYARSEMFVEQDAEADIGANLPLPEYSVELIAPGVALATYVSEVQNEGAVERARRSSLWTKINGRWQLRFHQGTVI